VKVSDLKIYKVKTLPAPVMTYREELKRIDSELEKIRHGRKELRYLAVKLMERRKHIIANLPAELRPKRGRPKKNG
jgi:hypothetical protein